MLEAVTGLFKKPDVKQQVRESQREMRKGEREIQREIATLQMQEKKMIAEIKAAAKTGNQNVIKIQAKALVRLRAQIAKLQASVAQLKGVSTQMTVGAPCVRCLARAVFTHGHEVPERCAFLSRADGCCNFDGGNSHGDSGQDHGGPEQGHEPGEAQPGHAGLCKGERKDG